MKCSHLPTPALLFLAPPPDTRAVEPRPATSLQGREAQPGGSVSTDLKLAHSAAHASASPTDLARASDAPEEGSKGHRQAPGYTPYPTQIPHPHTWPNGDRWLIGVMAVNDAHNEVLIVKDRFDEADGWRLPEGDWGIGQGHIEKAVEREAQATAGVVPDWRKPMHVDDAATKLGRDVRPGMTTSDQFPINTVLDKGAPVADARWERKRVPMEDAARDSAGTHPEQALILRQLKLGVRYRI